jgi:hypothetical protein
MKTISLGMRGPAVGKLQHFLNLAGATPPLEEDSIFGPLTQAAVKALQHASRIAEDGVVGPMTWTALANMLGMSLDISEEDFANTRLPVANVPTPSDPSLPTAPPARRGWLWAALLGFTALGVFGWIRRRRKMRVKKR